MLISHYLERHVNNLPGDPKVPTTLRTIKNLNVGATYGSSCEILVVEL